MLHKMGFDYFCKLCRFAKTYEQMIDDDEEICIECYVERQDRQREMILEASLERDDHD